MQWQLVDRLIDWRATNQTAKAVHPARRLLKDSRTRPALDSRNPAKLRRAVSAQVVEHCVGGLEEAMQNVDAFIALQIQRNIALFTVEGLMKHAVA